NHDSWITNPGDTVVWTFDGPFALFIDHDLAPCDDKPNAPLNPFGWTGVQSVTTAPYQITGQVLPDNDPHTPDILDQMFYKFTFWAPGFAPLDPDGICGSGL